jgi:hypothetical protein
LRLTLQRLEQLSDPAQDPDARAELKRILLLRIANLEALEVLRAEAVESTETPRQSPPVDPIESPLPAQVAPDPQSSPVTVPPDADRS